MQQTDQVHSYIGTKFDGERENENKTTRRIYLYIDSSVTGNNVPKETKCLLFMVWKLRAFCGHLKVHLNFIALCRKNNVKVYNCRTDQTSFKYSNGEHHRQLYAQTGMKKAW